MVQRSRWSSGVMSPTINLIAIRPIGPAVNAGPTGRRAGSILPDPDGYSGNLSDDISLVHSYAWKRRDGEPHSLDFGAPRYSPWPRPVLRSFR